MGFFDQRTTTNQERRNTFKRAARVAAPANVDITDPGTVIDGVTLAVGDTVFLGFQTDPAENGLWIYQGDDTEMTRHPSLSDSQDLGGGAVVFAAEGTANAGKLLVMRAESTSAGLAAAFGGTATIAATESSVTIPAATLGGSFGGQPACAVVQQAAADSTLTHIARCHWSDDDLVIEGNAASTADVTVAYVIAP